MAKKPLPSKTGMWFTDKRSLPKPRPTPPAALNENSGILQQIQAQEFTD